MYVLSEEARFEWEHGIGQSQSVINPLSGDVTVKDESYRRVSLTFRHVLEEGTKKVERGELTNIERKM